ncbi:MAG: hypothetical protein RL244_1538 [Pseudomonadota bacterium]|jgi:hypothetical protein
MAANARSRQLEAEINLLRPCYYAEANRLTAEAIKVSRKANDERKEWEEYSINSHFAISDK